MTSVPLLKELEAHLGISDATDALMQRAKRVYFMLNAPLQDCNAPLYRLLTLCNLHLKSVQKQMTSHVECIHGKDSTVTGWRLCEQLKDLERQLGLEPKDSRHIRARLDGIANELNSCENTAKSNLLAITTKRNHSNSSQLALPAPATKRHCSDSSQLALPAPINMTESENAWHSYFDCDMQLIKTEQTRILFACEQIYKENAPLAAACVTADDSWRNLSCGTADHYRCNPFLKIYTKKRKSDIVGSKFILPPVFCRALTVSDTKVFFARSFGMKPWTHKDAILRCRVMLMHMLMKVYRNGVSDWTVQFEKIFIAIQQYVASVLLKRITQQSNQFLSKHYLSVILRKKQIVIV